MSVSHPTLLSYPIKLRWEGWETDTHKLQQYGWQLSAEQDPLRGLLRLAIKNSRAKIYGISDITNFDYICYHKNKYMNYYEFLSKIDPIEIQLASQMFLHIQQIGPMNFHPIDAQPQFTTLEPKSIEDLILFAPNLARTQEIIIPEKSVLDLMDEILKKQEPARHEYFTNKVRDDKFNVSPRQKVHAQIISLVA